MEILKFCSGGGLRGSSLIEKSLIDVYVPFLPMEKQHVRQCAENEFRRQNYTPAHREAALQYVTFILFFCPIKKFNNIHTN